MNRHLKAVVIVPEAISAENYPAVYILHGWAGSYKDWTGHMDLRPLADKYKMILVTPHGDFAGWYDDSPIKKDSQFETHIAKEVVAFIDNHYPTIACRENRYICGLSMGGHGAVTLMIKHPDVFSAAGSMSGVMNVDSSALRFGTGILTGTEFHDATFWSQHSSLEIAGQLRERDAGLVIDCGVDDFTIGANRNMHRKLIDLGIPHEYWERPGAHSWDYWTNALEYHLLYFLKYSKKQMDN